MSSFIRFINKNQPSIRRVDVVWRQKDRSHERESEGSLQTETFVEVWTVKSLIESLIERSDAREERKIEKFWKREKFTCNKPHLSLWLVCTRSVRYSSQSGIVREEARVGTRPVDDEWKRLKQSPGICRRSHSALWIMLTAIEPLKTSHVRWITSWKRWIVLSRAGKLTKRLNVAQSVLLSDLTRFAFLRTAHLLLDFDDRKKRW